MNKLVKLLLDYGADRTLWIPRGNLLWSWQNNRVTSLRRTYYWNPDAHCCVRGGPSASHIHGVYIGEYPTKRRLSGGTQRKTLAYIFSIFSIRKHLDVVVKGVGCPVQKPLVAWIYG